MGMNWNIRRDQVSISVSAATSVATGVLLDGVPVAVQTPTAVTPTSASLAATSLFMYWQGIGVGAGSSGPASTTYLPIMSSGFTQRSTTCKTGTPALVVLDPSWFRGVRKVRFQLYSTGLTVCPISPAAVFTLYTVPNEL